MYTCTTPEILKTTKPNEQYIVLMAEYAEFNLNGCSFIIQLIEAKRLQP